MSTYYDELGYLDKPMGRVNAKPNSKVIKFVTPSGYKLDGFKIVDILDIETENPIIEVIGDSGRPVRLRVNRDISVWYPSEGLSSSYNKLTHKDIVLDDFLTKNDKDIVGNVTDERMYQKFKDGKYNRFTYKNSQFGDKDNNYKYTTKDTAYDGVFIAYDVINSMFAQESTILDSTTKSTINDRKSPRKWEEPIQEILTSEEEQAKQGSVQGESELQGGGGKRRSKSNNKKPKKTAKRSKRAKRSKSRRTRRQRK